MTEPNTELPLISHTERKPNTWLYRAACPDCSYRGDQWTNLNLAQHDARVHRRECHA